MLHLLSKETAGKILSVAEDARKMTKAYRTDGCRDCRDTIPGNQ